MTPSANTFGTSGGATMVGIPSETDVNISVLNGVFGKLFSAERFWLNRFNFPFGVSIVVVARRA